jgi:SAM-dependent methyltransferase
MCEKGCVETAASPLSDVEKGAALYDAKTLRLYDLVVHGLSNPLAWRCPTKRLRQLYDDNVSARHLDVGVGSGYFLHRSRSLRPGARVSLLDLNPQALRYAEARIARFRPTLHVGNVLERVEIAEAPFDSIALMYLLHCVPGDLKTKARAFDHLGACLAERGVLFGATILGRGVKHTVPARALLKLYNSRGIFGNAADSKEDLEQALAARFREHRVEIQGCVALFVARGYFR